MGRARKRRRKRQARQRCACAAGPTPAERTEADRQRLMAGLRRCGWHSLKALPDPFADAHRKAMLREFPAVWAWWTGLKESDRAELLGAPVEEREVLLWGLRPGDEWQDQLRAVPVRALEVAAEARLHMARRL